jgi:hypothetical protein
MAATDNADDELRPLIPFLAGIDIPAGLQQFRRSFCARR